MAAGTMQPTAAPAANRPAGLPPPPWRTDPRARQPHLTGMCPVCGRATRFFYSERLLWRETLTCEHCLSTSRYRSVARGLLQAVRDLAGIHAQSLAGLPVDAQRPRLAVYDTQPPFHCTTCAYPLPDYLRRTGWIDVHLSQYKPDRPPGTQVSPGVFNQNLEGLTFADASLDIVITSDVMEHVRLDDRAHREIHRVLKPGGCYLFTVPHDLGRADTLTRVRVHEPGDTSRDEHLMEPGYHGDTDGDGSGRLVYRLYGRDLLATLAGLGFEVTYTRLALPHQGVLQTELFHCRKPRG